MGESPPSSVIRTPLVYSSSGRFHGVIQKSKASLSTRSEIVCCGEAGDDCAKAAPSGAASITNQSARAKDVSNLELLILDVHRARQQAEHFDRRQDRLAVLGVVVVEELESGVRDR